MLKKYAKLAFPLQNFARLSPWHRFSSKQSEKSRQKLEKERVYASVSALDTMADQEALTQESLNKIISERRLEIEQVASETSIPTSALLAATLITIPVVFGPVSLYIFSHYGTFAQFLPAFMHALLKYHAVQLNFLAGVHWGFAISEHNCQADALNSSPMVRRLFVCATLPMFAAFGLVSGLVYSPAMSANAQFLHLTGLILTHLYIFAMDYVAVEKKIAPKWLVKLKTGVLFFSVAGIAGIYLLFALFREKFVEKNNIYQRFLENHQQRLNIKLKNANN